MLSDVVAVGAGGIPLPDGASNDADTAQRPSADIDTTVA